LSTHGEGSSETPADSPTLHTVFRPGSRPCCTFLPERYRLPLVVLEQTGMRLGELEGLSWGDVDEGRSRRRVSAGLTSRCVTSLALSGRRLQIGTGGGRVFTKQIFADVRVEP